MLKTLFLLLLSVCITAAHAQTVTVTDGSRQSVSITQPVRKVVTLTPHAAELAYSAGLGSRLVGVTQESDYPAPVKALPKIGTYTQINLEAILMLKPDLVIAWQDGGQQTVIQALKKAHIPVFVSHPLAPNDIANEIHALGVLGGTPNIAQQNTAPFRAYLHTLSANNHTPAVKTAFLVGQNPIFAITDHSFLGKMMQTCGAVNVFGKPAAPAFPVNTEALLQQPADIVFVGSDTPPEHWQTLFSRLPTPPDVQPLKADLRPSLRIKSSLQQMCLIIERKRQTRH